MFRVALVGAGGMAETHARAYANMPGAELVGVMDIRVEAANRVSSACGGRAFTDFDEMITILRPDVIDVSPPTPFHADYVCRAAAFKPLGIVVEKPMARTVSECEKMITTCENAGVPLFVAHVLRFFPDFALATEQVHAGAVGNPAVVRTRRGGPFPHGWDNWYGKTAMSGGVLLDLVIHDFDWLRATFGEVERVYCKGIAARSGAPEVVDGDYALTTLKFRSGVVAHVEATWSDPGGFKANFEIAGDAGVLESNFMQQCNVPFLSVTTAEDDKRQAVPTPESPLALNPYQAELEHFLDCLKDGTTPKISPRDGLEAVRISEAAAESVRTGKPITL